MVWCRLVLNQIIYFVRIEKNATATLDRAITDGNEFLRFVQTEQEEEEEEEEVEEKHR